MPRQPTSKTPTHGLGDVLGTLESVADGKTVALRTPPAFVLKYARGYTDGGKGHLAVERHAGTQYGAARGDTPFHKGEDLYFQPGTPTLAPFDGTVTAIYKADASADYGDIVVLQSKDDPRFKTRIVHLERVEVRKGDAVQAGDALGVSYTRPNFPLGDPSHIHFEATLGSSPSDRGNTHPLSVFDASALIEPRSSPRPNAGGASTSNAALIVGGVVGGLAFGALLLAALSTTGGTTP